FGVGGGAGGGGPAAACRREQRHRQQRRGGGRGSAPHGFAAQGFAEHGFPKHGGFLQGSRARGCPFNGQRLEPPAPPPPPQPPHAPPAAPRNGRISWPTRSHGRPVTMNGRGGTAERTGRTGRAVCRRSMRSHAAPRVRVVALSLAAAAVVS